MPSDGSSHQPTNQFSEEANDDFSDLDDFEMDTGPSAPKTSTGVFSAVGKVTSSLSSVFLPFKSTSGMRFWPPDRGNSSSPFLGMNGNNQDEDDDNYDQYASNDYNPHRQIAYEDLSAIDWQYEYAKERLRKEKLDKSPGVYGTILSILDFSNVWIVLILTGISVAVVAAFIDIVSRWLADVKFGHCTDAFYLTREYCCSGISIQDPCPKWESWETSFGITNSGFGSYLLAYIFYVIFTVLFAVSASILVLFYAPHARFSGMPEIKTILSGFIIKGFLGFRTLALKAIGLILVVSAGLWVGKEGPLVHVACCCASVAMMLFPQLYHNEAIKREVLTAASSAGISVAFGSPIGGVLFALEQLSYYFPEKILWNSFVAAMVAAVTLQFINPFRTGNLVLFQVVYDRVWHRFELVPFAFLGVLGGLYGALFNQLNIYFAKWRRNNAFISRKPVLEVALVAVVTGVVTFPNIYTRIPASLSLAHLFQECSDSAPGKLCDNHYWFSTFFLLSLSSIQGFFLTAYTFGTDIPAGLIMPSMVNGAFMGRAVGILMQTWRQKYPDFILFESCPPDRVCVTPGVYALVGAASALSGVTHLTVSTVVLLFELTGALNYVIPIMTGVMVSKWVSDAFNKKGIYEIWIQFKEYPFLDNHNDQPIPDVSVESIMTKVEDLSLIPATGSTIGSLSDLLKNSTSKGFPIVKSVDNMTLVGYITYSELRHALQQYNSSPPETPCSFSNPVPFRQDVDNETLFSVDDYDTTNKQSSQFQRYRDNEGVSLFEDDSNQPSSSFQNIDAINLREWAELNPMTLSWESSLQLAASMFSKLGLRFILFTHKGQLRGLLTRKDVWLLLNSFDTDMSGPASDILNESESTARGRLLSTISYSLRGSEDEARLLAGDDEDLIDARRDV